MSLLDSLLLDPARLDVWIALRTDGVKGTGTESDPYDGSVRPKPVLTGITISRSGNIATVTANNHGYPNGSLVVIAGATGPDGAYYNGTFGISNVTQNTFDYGMTGTPGASATGSLTCTLDPYEFDALMRSLPAYTTIHLGPGTFETKGFSFSEPALWVSWQPKSGWRILGSGMGATVLKLVEASIASAHYVAIGNIANATAYRSNGLEIADLTVDCNLDGQPVPQGLGFAPIICGAILAGGSDIRIRRVRAINFGGQSSAETFVIMMGYGSPDVPEVVDCVVEDCICDQPSVNSINLTTVINIGSGERSTDGVTAYHRACVIRNCLIDCEYKVNPVPISQIVIAGGLATVTTGVPHGRANNDWVVITGALVNGSIDNTYNGSYQISVNPSFPDKFTYSPASPAPSTNPIGDMWVGRFSSHLVPITNISRSPSPGPYTITVTTGTPHFRVPGNNVVVSATPDAYSGSFKITNVPSPTQFQFVLNTDPGTPSGWSHIGVQFQATGNDAGTGAVVEGNRIFNCRVGGPYHDTYTTRDLIVRNNHYRGVVVGPAQGLGVIYGSGLSGLGVAVPLMSLDHSGNTALAETFKPHGLSSRDAVGIAGVTGPGSGDGSYYNGTFNITTTGSTTFQYTMTGTPTGKATGTPGFFVYDPDHPETNTYHPLNSLSFAAENGAFVATVESWYEQHGLSVGDAVIISRASRSQYNGYFTVTAVIAAVPGTSNEKFKYVLPADPIANSTSGYFGRLWQAGRVVIEDNLIELIPTPTSYGPPIGIELDYGSFVSPPLFRQVVIRRNVIRHVDNASDPPNLPKGIGIQVSGCGNLILEENVVDLDASTPIKYYLCDKVSFFNNQTSSGILIQGYDTGLSKRADELPVQIEDAWLLAI